MYDLKTIKKTLKLLHKYDCQFAKTSRETGIKARTIRRWYNCEKAGLPLLVRPFVHTKKGKRTSEQMKKCVIIILNTEKIFLMQLKNLGIHQNLV